MARLRQIQFRKDTAANWSAANPVLAIGEPGFETNTRKLKIGDGTSGWNALAYSFDGAGMTTEEVQDIVGAMFQTGTNMSFNYNDATGKLELDAIQLTTEEVQDKVGAFLSGGANTTVTYNDGANTVTIAETTAGKTTEEIQDIVSGLLSQGANITLTYNDAGNVLTIAAAGGVNGTGNSQGDYSLEFNAAKNHHVNCGVKFIPGEDRYSCFYQAWVKLRGSITGYFLSDSYSGAHYLLFGASGSDGVGGGYNITGNFNDGTNANTYGSFDKMQPERWYHVAFSYSHQDGKTVVYINGVPAGIANYTGTLGNKRNIPTNAGGVLFIGGSDHSNISGNIKTIGGYEFGLTQYPIPYNQFASPKNLLVFQPEKSFRSNHFHSIGGQIKPELLFDFSVKTEGTIPDLMGKNNGKRSCNLNEATHDSGVWGLGGTFNNVESNYDDNQSMYPKFVPAEFVQGIYKGNAPRTIPSGARLYADFRQNDITYAWQNPDLGLPVARTGQAWFSPLSTYFGIILENVFCAYPAAANLVASVGNADQDVRVQRPAPSGYSLAGEYFGLIARYLDENNYLYLYCAGGNWNLFKRVAGIETLISSGAHAIPDFTSIRLSVIGNDAIVFVNDVLKSGVLNVTGTGSGQQAGYRHGGSPLTRLSTVLEKAPDPNDFPVTPPVIPLTADEFVFRPRAGSPEQSLGIIVQGCATNSSTVGDWTTLLTIGGTVNDGVNNSRTISGGVAYPFLRCLVPNGVACSLAEFEFRQSGVKIQPIASYGSGSFGLPDTSYNFAKALDGDVNTFFGSDTGATNAHAGIQVY